MAAAEGATRSMSNMLLRVISKMTWVGTAGEKAHDVQGKTYTRREHPTITVNLFSLEHSAVAPHWKLLLFLVVDPRLFGP